MVISWALTTKTLWFHGDLTPCKPVIVWGDFTLRNIWWLHGISHKNMVIFQWLDMMFGCVWKWAITPMYGHLNREKHDKPVVFCWYLFFKTQHRQWLCLRATPLRKPHFLATNWLIGGSCICCLQLMLGHEIVTGWAGWFENINRNLSFKSKTRAVRDDLFFRVEDSSTI